MPRFYTPRAKHLTEAYLPNIPPAGLVRPSTAVNLDCQWPSSFPPGSAASALRYHSAALARSPLRHAISPLVPSTIDFDTFRGLA